MLVSSPNQILMSPTNNSTAKAQYSFPKAERFPKEKVNSHNFYTIPNSLDKRSTTFGYGHKYDFTSDKEKTPDPGAYKTDSDLLNKSKAFTFGISRESSKQYIKGQFKSDSSTPGPGAYAFSPKFGKEGKNITISGRKQIKINNDYVPGPGAYNQSLVKGNGDYLLSTCKSLESFKFSPNSPRFPKNQVEETPAPGCYEIDKGFLRNSQVLSTFKSSGARMFAKSQRTPLVLKSESPGPGCYRLPSEFGYYDGLGKSK